MVEFDDSEEITHVEALTPIWCERVALTLEDLNLIYSWFKDTDTDFLGRIVEARDKLIKRKESVERGRETIDHTLTWIKENTEE